MARGKGRYAVTAAMPLARAAGSGRSHGHSMVLVTLAWATVLVLVCRAGGAGAPEGARRRRLQWGGGCPAQYVQARTHRVMDACCPPPLPLQPGQEPTPTTCDMPASCSAPSCAHEFLEFFEDCADRVASAQPPCECPTNFGTLTVFLQLEVLNRRFRNMIREPDPTAAWTLQSRPSTPSASGSSAESRSSTQPSSLPMTARRRARTPVPTAGPASMGASSAARQSSVPPAVSDLRPLYYCVRARAEPCEPCGPFCRLGLSGRDVRCFVRLLRRGKHGRPGVFCPGLHVRVYYPNKCTSS